MPPKHSWLTLSILLALVRLAVAGNPQASSIYRLEIKQTSSGPLVVGMFFDRFEQPPMASCGTAHCFGGSHNPGECESLVIPVVHPQCAANPASCNYSVLEASKKGCSCLCTTYVGTCTGCSVGGYCTSPAASDWQRKP